MLCHTNSQSITIALIALFTVILGGCAQQDSSSHAPVQNDDDAHKAIAMQANELAGLTDTIELIVADPEVAMLLQKEHHIPTALPYGLLVNNDMWDSLVRINNGVLVSMQLLDPYNHPDQEAVSWYHAFSAMFGIHLKDDGSISCRGMLFLGDKNGGGPYVRLHGPRIGFSKLRDLMAILDESMNNLDAVDQKVYLKWYDQYASELGMEQSPAVNGL